MNKKIVKSFSNLLIGSILIICMQPVIAFASTLNIYVWEDSISPDIIKLFERSTGTSVQVDSYTSNEELLDKLRTDDAFYDLIMPSQHFLGILIKENLIMDFKAHSRDAFNHIDPQWKGMWWDEDNRYSIPFAYGTTSYVVNRDLYKGIADSWKQYFEPTEELRGKISVFGEPDDVIQAAQNYLGIEYCSEDREDMNRVLELLLKQKPYVREYSNDDIEIKIARNDLAMQIWWDGDALRTKATQGVNIEYVWPKEGVVGWMDLFAIPSKASNIDNAKRFIDFISIPRYANIQENYYGFRSAIPNEDQGTKKYSLEYAPELYPTVPIKYSRACSDKAAAMVSEIWKEVTK